MIKLVLIALASLADRACGGLFKMPRPVSLLVSGVTGGVCAYMAGATGWALVCMYLAYSVTGRKFWGLGAFQGNALRRMAGLPHTDVHPTNPEDWYPMFIKGIERQYAILALIWGYLSICSMFLVGLLFSQTFWPLLAAPFGAVLGLWAGQAHQKYIKRGDAWATIEVVRGLTMPLCVWGAYYVISLT